VDTDLRASLIASGAAAILSILVGAISGVGFLAIVLRALAGGIVFGAIVYGALVLFRRFLPELFSNEAGSEAEEPMVGGAVDIVLPGEEPVVAAEAELQSQDLESRPAEAAALPGTEAVGPGPRAAAQAPERPARAAVPPVASRNRRSPAFAAEEEEAEDVTPYLGESLIDGDGAEEAEAADLSPAGQVQQSPLMRPSDGLDDLDVLPDLESLSDGFSTSMGSSGMPSATEVSEPDRRPREGGRRGDADPAMLAQAVRTLLKRDQER
jgi:hypothetical protein